MPKKTCPCGCKHSGKCDEQIARDLNGQVPNQRHRRQVDLYKPPSKDRWQTVPRYIFKTTREKTPCGKKPSTRMKTQRGKKMVVLQSCTRYCRTINNRFTCRGGKGRKSPLVKHRPKCSSVSMKFHLGCFLAAGGKLESIMSDDDDQGERRDDNDQGDERGDDEIDGIDFKSKVVSF